MVSNSYLFAIIQQQKSDSIFPYVGSYQPGNLFPEGGHHTFLLSLAKTITHVLP